MIIIVLLNDKNIVIFYCSRTNDIFCYYDLKKESKDSFQQRAKIFYKKTRKLG